MLESIDMHPHSFKFDDETELMLRSFCKASNGASMQTVVNHALKAYILAELEANKGIKQSYNQIRKKHTGGNIRLVNDFEK
jgi:hypothetical protein